MLTTNMHPRMTASNPFQGLRKIAKILSASRMTAKTHLFTPCHPEAHLHNEASAEYVQSEPGIHSGWNIV
jgi:hypothetical protein